MYLQIQYYYMFSLEMTNIIPFFRRRRIGHLYAIVNFSRNLHTGKYPFEMPTPIERSPADLLQALADTIKQDETAPNFAFIDDSYLIPTSCFQKKQFLLSKEFGRRTARRFVEEWPTLFMFDRDIPQLAAFRPEKQLDPFIVEPTEENLAKMIKNRQVTDALKLYEKIEETSKEQQENKVQISTSVKLDLFRLLCYYNDSDLPLTEKEWDAIRIYSTSIENPISEYSSRIKGKKEALSTVAEQLFAQLPKTDETYSLLICGLCKFPTENSLEKAKMYYKQIVSAGHVPFEEVFNLMIRTKRPFGDSTQFGLMSNATEWLREMARFGIRPSIQTFNALFYSILGMNSSENESNQQQDQNQATVAMDNGVNDGKNVNEKKPFRSGSRQQQQQALWDFALTLISEMNRLGIEQSLLVYWKTLELVPKDGKENNNIQLRVNILDEILRRLEEKLEKGEQIEFTDPEDPIFFYTAIGISSLALNEPLLDRLIHVYKHKNNRVKIQNPWDEAKFYINYLLPKIYSLPLDAFLIVYKQYVPNFVGITPVLLGSLLSEMRFRKPAEFCWPLLKRVIEDCISSRTIETANFSIRIMEHLRDIKRFHLSEPDAKEYIALSERLIYSLEQIELLNKNRQEYKEKMKHEWEAKKATESSN